ncbi:MAG TPA: crossover junction endodeoxyribonuclease RuvC [Gemmatimonadetes bacterium]|nr:crossover junction endodeoxyribonuclease RuvC [Gemmatimonadota bacterium]
MSSELILGIDPGTIVTGYGVIQCTSSNEFSLRECGVFRTSSKQLLGVRVREIYDEVKTIIDRFDPDVVVVEDVFVGKNARSALMLGHVRGVILLAAEVCGVPVAQYTPREIKKAVAGNGNATKDQVAFMVQKRLRLKEVPSPSDASDAVAAALSYSLLGG